MKNFLAALLICLVSATSAKAQFVALAPPNQVVAGPNGGGTSEPPTPRALVGADLPSPSASTLGGIESIVAAAHQWIASIDPSGVPHQSQPACADISDATTPCNGSAAVVRTYTEQGMTLLNVITVTNGDASESDTSSFTSNYNDYLVVFENVVPVTNAVDLYLQVHSNGSFQTSNYNGSATQVSLTSATTISNSAGTGFSAAINIIDTNSTAAYKVINAGRVSWFTSASAITSAALTNAWFGATTAIDGIKIFASSGNLASGTIKIYGLRNAL
jgi:hypothetical protein